MDTKGSSVVDRKFSWPILNSTMICHWLNTHEPSLQVTVQDIDLPDKKVFDVLRWFINQVTDPSNVDSVQNVVAHSQEYPGLCQPDLYRGTVEMMAIVVQANVILQRLGSNRGIRLTDIMCSKRKNVISALSNLINFVNFKNRHSSFAADMRDVAEVAAVRQRELLAEKDVLAPSLNDFREEYEQYQKRAEQEEAEIVLLNNIVSEKQKELNAYQEKVISMDKKLAASETEKKTLLKEEQKMQELIESLSSQTVLSPQKYLEKRRQFEEQKQAFVAENKRLNGRLDVLTRIAETTDRTVMLEDAVNCSMDVLLAEKEKLTALVTECEKTELRGTEQTRLVTKLRSDKERFAQQLAVLHRQQVEATKRHSEKVAEINGKIAVVRNKLMQCKAETAKKTKSLKAQLQLYEDKLNAITERREKEIVILDSLRDRLVEWVKKRKEDAFEYLRNYKAALEKRYQEMQQEDS